MDLSLTLGLALAYASFVIMVNCAGALWASRAGWNYLWWMPVSILAYLAAGYAGTSVASLPEIAVAGALASFPDTVVSSWYSWRRGILSQEFEGVEEYVGGIILSFPVLILFDIGLYLGGALLGRWLLGPL